MGSSRFRWFARFGAAGAFLLAAASPGEAQGAAKPAAEPPAIVTRPNDAGSGDEPVKLDPVDVTARSEGDGVDATGMGSHEYQLKDTTFSNDMISADAIEDNPAAMEIALELGHVATPSSVDLATADSRVGLRGFPTPLLTNGFVRLGSLDLVNIARTVVIQGALVPVLGRGAPGGIQDFWTNRPRAVKSQRYDVSLSSLRRQTAALEVNGITAPKRAWHRLAADWSRRVGPETFAVYETRTVDAAVTWKHSPAASTLFALDYMQIHTTAAPGIPEYRVATGQRIVRPYLPIAGFNALGPEAGIRRRSTMATVILDAQPHPKVALRAGIEAWWRRIEQDRFTTGLLNLATMRFEGIREPLHSEQPEHAQVGRAEATARLSGLGGEHKLMLAASHTFSSYLREERALSVAARNALPASVRTFNPYAPDYSRPAYRADDYNRILTDRRERTRYSALELSERYGIAQGRTVFTAGVRQDLVGLKLHDRRAGLAPALARVSDSVGELTYHAGVNHQAVPSRLLLFATTSTAFNPSTRVDARTGRIQGNETTGGHEGGFKARFAPQRLDFTTSVFTFANQDISRRNPLYGDPVQDANHTQPQLVAAGEERYTGGKIEGSWRPWLPLTIWVRGTYVRGITTASPDLPEEVGRQLTRFPAYNASVAGSYGFGKGSFQGLSLSASWVYVSDFVAYYEDRQRLRQDYPGYAVTTLSAGYSRRVGKFTHAYGLSVRNLFDTDLVQKLARLGAGREAVANYRIMF